MEDPWLRQIKNCLTMANVAAIRITIQKVDVLTYFCLA